MRSMSENMQNGYENGDAPRGASPLSHPYGHAHGATSGALELLPLPAETLDLQLDDVTGAQVRLGLGLAHGDAGGRAGVDDVARVQGHEPADVPDDLGDGEDLVRGVAVLLELAVDPQF